MTHMEHQLLQAVLTTQKLERQLQAESHTLEMLRGHSRWLLASVRG